MNYLKPVLLVAAVSTLSACTTVKNWMTDTPNVENTKQSTTTLVVPGDLTTPVKSSEFDLPPGSHSAKPSNNMTSPSSVLEILQGSWIDNDDKHPYKVMLEKPKQVDNFEAFIRDGIKAMITSKGYKLLNSDNGYRIEVEKTKLTGFWFWENEIKTERFVYDLFIDVLPHGRSASAYVEPVELEVLNKNLAPKFSNKFRKQQLSIEAINQLSIELDYQFRVVVQKQRALNDVSLVLGTNSAKQPVITSQRDIQFVFKEFEDVLDSLGFDIENEDKALYIYEVSYDQNDKSLFSGLWGSSYANKLTLPKGKYEVVMITNINGVHIAFSDGEGKPLSQAQVEELFELVMKVVEEQEIEL